MLAASVAVAVADAAVNSLQVNYLWRNLVAAAAASAAEKGFSF